MKKVENLNFSDTSIKFGNFGGVKMKKETKRKTMEKIRKQSTDNLRKKEMTGKIDIDWDNPVKITAKKTVRKVSPTKAKEQRIKAFLSKYKVKFDMKDDGIDLRAMSENYSDGIIPINDVSAAVNAILGPSNIPANSVDPRDGLTPKFAWVDNGLVGIDPRFQRDIAPNHVSKIELDFNGYYLTVACAVKHPVTGIYLIWDGNHGTTTSRRKGWSHTPIWYIDIPLVKDESEEDTIKRMVQLAGKAFLSINKKNKRPVAGYDEHMIRVETFEPIACQIQAILDVQNCRAVRSAEKPGEISHFVHLYGAYDLTQTSTGIKGIYLSRALNFCCTTWPREHIDPIVMLGMARLYALTENATGILLPKEFDVEFGAILKQKYGPSSVVGDGIKEEYENHFGGLAGHPLVLTSGLINSYNKHNTLGFKLAQSEAPAFPVR